MLDHFFGIDDERILQVIERFADLGTPLIIASDKTIEITSNNVVESTFLGINCGIVEATQHVSETAEAVLKKNKSVKIAFVWRYDSKKNVWHVSLRGRKEDENLDLGVMLRENIGYGGGHPKASGINIDVNEFPNVFQFIEKYKVKKIVE